jgi:nucleotide-binding universal stress UspA family protein
MDFSGASQRAAALAAQLLAEGGELTLANAEGAYDESTEANEGLAFVHREGLKAAFAQVVAKLSLPARATVRTVSVDSTPSAGLLELADRLSADLIAVGRQRHDPIERALFGSVALDIVRDGRFSVLVTPPAPRRRIRKAPATRTIF